MEYGKKEEHVNPIYTASSLGKMCTKMEFQRLRTQHKGEYEVNSAVWERAESMPSSLNRDAE